MLKDKLEELVNLMDEIEVLKLEKQDLVDEVLTPEIKTKIMEIDAEFVDKFKTVQAKADAVQETVKELTKLVKQTVKTDRLMAVYTKGKVSYDVDKLDGYAEAHPEIKVFRSTGKPSVSIRKI